MKKICVVLGLLVLAISSVTFAAERNENPNDYCYSNGGTYCDDNSYGGCRGGACGWRR